jgi:hypothetical protein
VSEKVGEQNQVLIIHFKAKENAPTTEAANPPLRAFSSQICHNGSKGKGERERQF